MAYPSQSLCGSSCYSYMPVPGIPVCPDLCGCTLKVEGTGNVKVRPEIAIVVLGVITEDKQLKVAQEENAARMTSVLNTLRKMGIRSEDIQTQSYNITPQYDYIEGKQVFRGYRVEHMMGITIRDMNRIGEIIDAAVQNGANQVNSIKFSIDNQSVYYRQALNAAVEDALTKARTLGSKLNIEVSQVPVRITEISYESGMPVTLAYQTAAPATPIQTGMIEVTARIEAVFVYRQMRFNTLS